MAREIDVYQLLRAFAQRNHLTEIEYKVFAQAVQRQARQADQSNPLFRDLGIDPDPILLPRLRKIAAEGRLALEMLGEDISTIVLPERFESLFLQEYRRIDESPEAPFPDEETLGVVVPPEWIRAAPLESDLGPLSEPGAERKFPLLRIVFPESVRPLVVPSAFVPDKLIEYAVLKIRHFLRRGGNKEYIYNKLLYAFTSRELLLKEAFGAVLTKPYEAIAELKRSSSDFTFTFWAYLTSHVRKDLDKKTDKTSEDLSIYQAALICEFYSNHFKGKAQRVLERELAFKALDLALRKPPFHFSITEILAFRDAKGQPLIGKYGEGELEARLAEKTTKSDPGSLPELLLVSLGKAGRAYVAKDKLFPLALRLASEARSDIRNLLLEEWRRQLTEFRSTPAMDDESAYRRELARLVGERFPLLESLLTDRLLPLVYAELEGRGELSAELELLVRKGELLPLEELLELPRKTLLLDAKMLLPFWYSVPILAGLMRLLRGRGAPRPRAERGVKAAGLAAPRQTAAKLTAPPSAAGAVRLGAAASKPASPHDRRAEFARAAAAVAKTLLPEGYAIDEYLRELEGRWNTLINAQSKANLTEDVNSLVRDYLRGVLRTMRGESFTPERVKTLAANLADTPVLLKIKNHAALELYLQVYMVKILSR